jgi:hypothetical protein
LGNTDLTRELRRDLDCQFPVEEIHCRYGSLRPKGRVLGLSALTEDFGESLGRKMLRSSLQFFLGSKVTHHEKESEAATN